jgi:hypothetical protein
MCGYSGSAKEISPPASILSKMLGLVKLIRLQFGIETYGKFGSRTIIFSVCLFENNNQTGAA